MTIHWCGTGLSAVPGLRRLIEAKKDVCVWNRTVDKAQEAVGDITDNILAFDRAALENNALQGDVIVSMLPGDWHVPLAELAISKGAHFVSSSYISPEMRALNDKASGAGLCLVNEVGLDPGIDHLMAHVLIEDYRASDENDEEAALSFVSYCGGIPKIPNPFRYKFSWSPAGVLKALKSPSKSIRDFGVFDVSRPWDAISSYTAPLGTPEEFEVYPNRDSLPFIEQYKFDPNWRIKEFVRGTLRLNGWAEAWAPVFLELETLSGPEGDARIREMSNKFWAANAYDEGEPDRVVLCVSLKAEKKGQSLWHKTYVMDAWGDARGPAMARLVSNPVSFAVEAIMAGALEPGVQAAPSNLALTKTWMDKIGDLAQYLKIIDHTES